MLKEKANTWNKKALPFLRFKTFNAKIINQREKRIVVKPPESNGSRGVRIVDEKFHEKAKPFSLLKNSKDEYFTLEEYKEKVKAAQTDKNDKLVFLYSHDKEEHHSLI